jgi:hypothetical protein
MELKYIYSYVKSLEFFAATEINEILLGRLQLHDVKFFRRYRENPCPCFQGVLVVW